jgi:hypothetical protein
MALLPALNKALGQVQEKLADLPPSDFTVETGLKPYPSMKRKLISENVRDPSNISDLARGRVFFSNQFHLNEVLDILGKLFDKQIKRVQKMPDAEGLEHHGITCVDLDCEGTNFELQLLPIEYQPYTDLFHQLSSRLKSPKDRDKLDEHQQKFLKKTHNKIHKGLHQKAKDNRN